MLGSRCRCTWVDLTGAGPPPGLPTHSTVSVCCHVCRDAGWPSRASGATPYLMGVMGFVRARLWADARRGWRSWVALALVAGVAWGGAIATFGGARRTETAYNRFLEGTERFDVLLTNGSTPDIINRQFDFGQVVRLPQVQDAAPVSYYFPSGATQSGRRLAATDITPFAATDGRFGTELNHAEVLQGRLATAEDDVAVSFLAADQYDIDVGDELSLSLTGPGAFAPDAAPSSPTPFRVVGVVAVQGAFPPLSPSGSIPPLVLLSPAYARGHPDAAEVLAVRLRGGRDDVAAFTAELERMAGRTQVVTLVEEEQTSVVQRGLDVHATILRLFAAALASVALLVSGLAMSRLALADADDRHALHALGATRPMRLAAVTARALLIAVGTAAVAVASAGALSPLAPVGVARQAELRPGVELNAAVLGLGAATVAVAVLLVGVAAGWRSEGSTAANAMGAVHSSRPVSALARTGAPVVALVGVRNALERGRGRTAAPVRITIVGTALGVAIVAAMLTFTGSLARLFDRPPLYGWNWNLQVGSAFSPDLANAADELADNPSVTEVAVAGQARMQANSQPIDALGVDEVRGSIEPTVVDGRAPSRPDEILLGTQTMRDLDLAVGDTVEVAFGDRSRTLQVVGRGVMSEFAGAARLGEGASMTFDGLRALVPDAVRSLVLVRTGPGVDPEMLADELRGTYGTEGVYLPTKPSDLADLERVGGLPLVVAGLVGLMALAVLASTVSSSVRRRQRDIAVLKALGFVRGQVLSAVVWQSSTFALLAGLIGLPLGIATGRAAWTVFAERLGVPPRPSSPLLTTALLVPALLLLANLMALVPGRHAARARPAATLRVE